jgi:hypothetical protein
MIPKMLIGIYFGGLFQRLGGSKCMGKAWGGDIIK